MDNSHHPTLELYTRAPSDCGITDHRSLSSASLGDQPLQQPDHKSQPLITRSSARQTADAQAEPTSSPHQQYLDSLQPPSDQDFARLCSLQETREREHRQRDSELRRQDKITSRKTMEARRDFMKSKVLEEEGSKELDEPLPNYRGSALSRGIHELSNSQLRSHNSSDDGNGGAAGEDGSREVLKAKAATVIQRSYRGYRVRREIQGLGLDASTRWTHAIRDAQWKELTKPRAREDHALSTGEENGDEDDGSRTNARRNWMKVATITRRAGGDEDSDVDRSVSGDSSSSSDSEELARMDSTKREAARKKKQKAQAKRRKHARMMGLQYFLEMVDVKHRYGSNLRTYHEEWKRSDTNENYFYWLDYGEGKDVEVATCPRERLDRERVRYLNREERQHYLVKVDHEGRLVWAKNGIRIDTTEEWKDSIHGIVPVDDPTPAFSPEIESHTQYRAHDNSNYPHRPRDRPSSRASSPSSSSRESELEAARAAKYANTDLDNAKGVKKIKHVSAATIFNKLLRKSVRKNTWIFVADTAFRLYVGIKASGAFQHSSFLQGARISAAGLIKVKDGRLSSLSPLSGHYRPPAANFRAFVHSLEDEGVDMTHVSISRSYAVLVGLEMYVKTRRKGKQALRKASLKTTEVFHPEEARRRKEEAWDKSQSAARERRVLEREREVLEREREENKIGVRILQKLGVQTRPSASGPEDGESGVVEQGEEGKTVL